MQVVDDEKPDSIIRVRPRPAGRVTRWEVRCDDCGVVSDQAINQEQATRLAAGHSDSEHGSKLLIRTAKGKKKVQINESNKRKASARDRVTVKPKP